MRCVFLSVRSSNLARVMWLVDVELLRISSLRIIGCWSSHEYDGASMLILIGVEKQTSVVSGGTLQKLASNGPRAAACSMSNLIRWLFCDLRKANLKQK